MEETQRTRLERAHLHYKSLLSSSTHAASADSHYLGRDVEKKCNDVLQQPHLDTRSSNAWHNENSMNGRSLIPNDRAMKDKSTVLTPQKLFPNQRINKVKGSRREVAEVKNPLTFDETLRGCIPSSSRKLSTIGNSIGHTEITIDDEGYVVSDECECQQTREDYLRHSVMEEYRDSDCAECRYNNSSAPTDTVWDEKSSSIITLQLEIDRLKEKLSMVVESAERAVGEVSAAQKSVSEKRHDDNTKAAKSNQHLLEENSLLKSLLSETKAQLADERCHLLQSVKIIERLKNNNASKNRI